MSLEWIVPLRHETPPTRAEWQAALDELEFDLQLHPELDLAHDRGFSPTTLGGRESGFELDVVDRDAALRDHPSLVDDGAGDGPAICFRWGGDLAECACVMAAAAGLLAGGWGVTAYSPDDDMTYGIAELAGEFRSCLGEM